MVLIVGFKLAVVKGLFSRASHRDVAHQPYFIPRTVTKVDNSSFEPYTTASVREVNVDLCGFLHKFDGKFNTSN